MTRKEIEQDILKELNLLKKEHRFIIHNCFKGYPAEFSTKNVDGVVVTIETKPAYARMEYCIDLDLNGKEIQLAIIDKADLQCFKNILSNSDVFFKDYFGKFNEI